MKLQNGAINFTPRDASIAIARQVMPREMMDLTIREYFSTAFTGLSPVIPEVLSASEKLSGIHKKELDLGYFHSPENSAMARVSQLLTA